MYLYRISFEVHTDQKPLISLFKPTANPPPWIERWLMRLMSYTFTILYQPGSSNTADYLSRSNPLPLDEIHHHAKEHVNVVVTNTVPVSITLAQIRRKATADDNSLSNLVNYLQSNSFPSVGHFAPFQCSRFRFSTLNGIV